ncbi:MAG: TetR/AcrR family transcriptional regulator [Ignavibacteria bacterium]|nr:TetR/AcrR family transcriptional regulator [Ignavibacteria bacterium]MBI3764959.1 TetR/AcrR family transcriptional regulator [Ignavibacteriales bacterium]
MKESGKQSSAKESLLATGTKLVLSKGFTATSVDEICKEAGVTKGGFFHYFKSKEDFGKSVIEYFSEMQKGMVERSPFYSKKDPVARVLGMVDFFIEAITDPNTPNSCVIGNMTQELAETNARIRSACCEKFDYWSSFFKQELDAAFEKNRTRGKHNSIDTASLSSYLITIIQGSLLLIKAKRDSSIGKKNLLHFKEYLKILLTN